MTSFVLPYGARERRGPARAVAILLLALLSSPCALAARLPDWAKDVSATAPALEEGVPRYQTRVLLDETRLTFEADGTLRRRCRYASQILSAQVEKLRLKKFDFREGIKVKVSKAWHLPPDEKARRSYLPPLDLTLEDSFLTDQKSRIVAVSGVKRGSIVFFEFESVEKPWMLASAHMFGNDVPVKTQRLEVDCPASWKVLSAWLRSSGPDPAIEGTVRRWELSDLVPPEDERLAEPAGDRAPLLSLALVPPGVVDEEIPIIPDWLSFGQWYEGVMKERDAVTPEIQAAARKIQASSGTDAVAQIRAAAAYVRDSVRYVAREIGIGNIQPHRASEVLSLLHGDCKDKGTLLRSILKAMGRPSYAVLVNSQVRETVADVVPGWGFDHFVVAIPLPEGSELSDALRPAVVDGGDLGRLLIVDTTNPYLSIGSLPAYLAGKKVLVTAGAKSRILALPQPTAGNNRIVRTFSLTVTPERTLAVSRSTSYSGEPGSEARSRSGWSQAERRKAVEGSLSGEFVDAVLTDYSTIPESDDGAYQEIAKWKVRIPDMAGPPAIPLFPAAGEELARLSLAKRRSAVVYPIPVTVRYDSVIANVPEGSSLPEMESAAGDGWSVTSRVAREGSEVRASWELVLSRQRFEPESFPELRKLWQAISSTAESKLHLPQ